MSKYYYVDSENIGDDWIRMLEQSGDDDHFLVFYTAKSPHMSYPNVVKLLSLNKNIEYILCKEGNNALDFQLVTYLGYELCKAPDNEIIIVSKDTGYDAIIDFWKKRDIVITRITASNFKAVANKEPVKAEAEPAIISVPVVPVEEKISGVSKEEIDDVIAACGKKNTQNIHLFLTHFYGTKNGLNIYKHVTSKDYKPESRNWDEKKRFSILCKYIEKCTDTDGVTISDDVVGFVYKNRKNPDSILTLIKNQYGKTNGPRYSKIFKPYVKTLANL